MSLQEEEGGEGALVNFLVEIRELPPKGIHGRGVAKADLFASGAKQRDDMPRIVVRVS